MATKFNANFYVKEGHNQGWQNVEINWPKDQDRSTLYLEEKQNRRISRMIAAQTGYQFESIRLEELKPLN
jgi:hypothetical protein